MSATLFVKHEVEDYGHWKKHYDGLENFRKSSGVTKASIHRDAGDSSIIIVTHQFTDVESMKSFADSSELKSTMSDAGVIGKPEIWLSEDF